MAPPPGVTTVKGQEYFSFETTLLNCTEYILTGNSFARSEGQPITCALDAMARIKEIELLLPYFVGKPGIFGDLFQQLTLTDSFSQKLLADPHLFSGKPVNFIFLLDPDFAISLSMYELLLDSPFENCVGFNFLLLKLCGSDTFKFGL